MKLGRQPRAFDPRIPTHFRMKAMLKQQGVTLPPLPVKLDNADKLPGFVGMMCNDRIGDCTAAGQYHLIQLVSMDASGSMLTEPDACVEQFYTEVTDPPFDPATGANDNGAQEQAVLAYAMNTGRPMSDGSRHKIAAYFECDPHNLNSVCETIMEFGCAYIGFEVPAGWMESGPAPVLDADPSYDRIEGGHCVIVTGFDRTDPHNIVFNFISWGTKQWTITQAAWLKYVDECYGIVDPLWIIQQSGKTPYGMSLADLESMCDALRE